MRGLWAVAVAMSAKAACAAVIGTSSASPTFCASTPPMTATQQDRLLRFAAIVRRELEGSGERLALISRKGTDLARFGIRYSHAGLALEGSRNGPWSVRQLYYACDERRPRVYDQGLAGFVLGTDDPASSYVSIVLLPRDAADALERTALDDARVVQGLASSYSANAYAFATTYQNCNQWLAELMALAWGAPTIDDHNPRASAQRWLSQQGYEAATIDVRSHLLMAVAPFIPLLHWDDHPIDDMHALRVRTSLPTAIEQFVHKRLPSAQRIELCHDERRVVVRRGWTNLPDGCVPQDGDRVMAFD